MCIYIHIYIHHIYLLFSLILRWLANNSLTCFLKFCGYLTKFPLFFFFSAQEIVYYVQASSFISSVSKTHLCFRKLTPLSGQLKKNIPLQLPTINYCLSFLSLILCFLLCHLWTHIHSFPFKYKQIDQAFSDFASNKTKVYLTYYESKMYVNLLHSQNIHLFMCCFCH